MNIDSAKSRLVESARPYRPLLHLAVVVLTIGVIIRLLAILGYDARDISSVAGSLAFGLFFWLVSLLAIWTALGTGQWPRRAAGLMVGAAALAAVSLTFMDDAPLVILAGIQCAAVGVVLLVARWRGLQFYRATPLDATTTHFEPFKRGQFSIRDLLLWTAGAATVFGATQHMRVDVVWMRNELVSLAVIVTGFSALAIIAVWSAFGSVRWTIRLPALPIAIPFVVEAMLKADHGSSGIRMWAYLFVTVQAAGLAGSLLLLRVHGFRLNRRNRDLPTSFVDRAA